MPSVLSVVLTELLIPENRGQDYTMFRAESGSHGPMTAQSPLMSLEAQVRLDAVVVAAVVPFLEWSPSLLSAVPALEMARSMLGEPRKQAEVRS